MAFAERFFVLKSPFFLPFRNGQLTKVPECSNAGTSGTIVIRYSRIFWNAKIWAIPEMGKDKGSRMRWNLVFWNLCFLGIPEWLKNVISEHFVFWNPLFVAIQEWPINKGSRMPKCWYFRNDWCSVIHYCLMFWNATICAIPETGHDKDSRMC